MLRPRFVHGLASCKIIIQYTFDMTSIYMLYLWKSHGRTVDEHRTSVKQITVRTRNDPTETGFDERFPILNFKRAGESI